MTETAPTESPSESPAESHADSHPQVVPESAEDQSTAERERVVLPPPEVIDHMIADLGSMPTVTLMGVFTQCVELFDRRVFDLDHEQLDMAFLPSAGVGREPIRVLLGTLADRELRFVTNLRRTIAVDGAVLEALDTDAITDAGLYRGPADANPGPTDLEVPPAIGGFIATIHTLRQWTLDWLGVLPDAAWDRAGMDHELGVQTLRQQVARHLAHFQRDAITVCAKVEHFLGPAPAPEACADHDPATGGCGKPTCGCRP